MNAQKKYNKEQNIGKSTKQRSLSQGPDGKMGEKITGRAHKQVQSVKKNGDAQG